MTRTEIEKKVEVTRKVLEDAVAEALDRKRRLGQYAILGVNGKPVRVDAHDLPKLPPKSPDRQMNLPS